MAHIVLLEDNPWLGALYHQVLGESHRVTLLRDPYAAMEAIDHDRPDLIMLDIMLPGASGVQLLHELASYGDTAKIPKVLFSAALPAGLTSETLRAYGVVVALDKTTIRPKEVLQTVNQIVHTHANA